MFKQKQVEGQARVLTGGRGASAAKVSKEIRSCSGCGNLWVSLRIIGRQSEGSIIRRFDNPVLTLTLTLVLTLTLGLQFESKKSPLRFSDIFSKRLGIFGLNFTAYYSLLSTLAYKFLFNYLQL